MSARACAEFDAGFAPVTFEPITREELNAHLVLWGHRMGEIHRPTRGWSHGLRHEGRLLAVVATDTLIRERVAGLTRHEAVELSRLCAAKPDLCRVALRLWRSFAFPAIAAARGCRWVVSYQDAALHSGNLYRFDGWSHSPDRAAEPTPGPDAAAEKRSSGAGATIRNSGGVGPSV